MTTTERFEGPRRFRIIGTRPVRPDGIDKVTGRARYGADSSAPGMLVGRILRSPHAHARIVSIDVAAALALPGVKAVVTRADFGIPPEHLFDVLDNLMAGRVAFYDGHAVAAVAATSASIARRALALIRVEYEPLPHVTDVDEAMRVGAPELHRDRSHPSVPPGYSANVIRRHDLGRGDTKRGFADADITIERRFTTESAHQGYIEPQACLATVAANGDAELWCTTQGHFMVRSVAAAIAGLEESRLRVTASEIGGGFGGKTSVFIEPLALMLSRKSGRPVKLVMRRDEVFRATGPTSSTSIDVKIGMKRDGRITAATAELRYLAGAYPGSPVEYAVPACFARYDITNFHVVGYDVVANRPKRAAYRSPGGPQPAFGVESVIDELARALNLDPLEVRLKNSASEGSQAPYGATFRRIGFRETLEAAKAHPHYSAPIESNCGRGVASGFWFNFGGDSSVAIHINPDGSVQLVEGNPDIGGSRAALAMTAAEELGINYGRVSVVVADTAAIALNYMTDGSRVAFAVGLATIEATRRTIRILCERAARIWGIEPEAVRWEDGAAWPAGSNAGHFDPLTLTEIASKASETGGPISASFQANIEEAGVCFATHIADVHVDAETGAVRVIRYTIFQDAGRAIHPAYVEGQFQGAAAQGIGWALNEGYVYGADGRLQNPSFLDYRIPVTSDLPMLDTAIIEVPNPAHPYGVRGVGEVSIVPPMAAIANAIADATGARVRNVPLSPCIVLAALREKRPQP